ncbi:MAG TPA: DUF2752 domain-containing protein [Holophagaceae bacterium]|nr:DUF2752 domain-containing protein [Holophagaceae bacterium]
MRRIPWIASALALLLGLGWLGARAVAGGRLTLPPCPFKLFTGLPCATCGLTRCVLALARGELREALHWHPVAVLLVAFWALAAGWDLLRAWGRRPYPPLPESGWARAGVWILLLGTWALQAARHI